ncbi:MAG TPA: hypothetical protein VHB46_08820 [Burkholderiales bacterium]|nr:hypothetical protein [Burkholderiales bacterium]
MKTGFAIASAALVFLSPASGAADALGRLFFTPSQRDVLDKGKFVSAPVPEKPVPRTMQLSGVVTRSDSDRTVWVNGTPYHNASPDGVQIKTDPSKPATASISVPGKAANKIKVGQQLELNSGQVREGIARESSSNAAETAPASSGVPTTGTTTMPAARSKGTDGEPGKDSPPAR